MTETEDKIDKGQQRKSRIIFLVLVAVFGLPYLASFYFYFDDDASAGLSTSNSGQLISPMRAIGDIKFTLLDGTTKTTADYQGQWLMLTLASSRCEQQCNDNLYALKQIRRAQGVDRQRIQRLLVLLDDSDLDALKPRLQEFTGMDTISAKGEAKLQLESVLNTGDQALENAFFVVDPLGNYMMYYPPATHPKEILKDIERLMKVSQI